MYFPKYITNKIIKQIIIKTTTADQSAADSGLETIIWFQLLYCGDNSVQLANSCIRKIKSYRKKIINIKFKLLYDTTNHDVFF